MADTCELWTSETGYAQASLYAACPWCELKRLKQELSLAEEGLANYAQEVEKLQGPYHDAQHWKAQHLIVTGELAAAGQEVVALKAENERLETEVQRLQRALAFWLPSVPAEGPDEIASRIGDDAHLLAGFEGPEEMDAEERGWIELQVPPQIRQLCPECLGYMPCALHPSSPGSE